MINSFTVYLLFVLIFTVDGSSYEVNNPLRLLFLGWCI